ncbi:hypothetical protein BG003_010818, partial [Podila horticola]
MPTEAYSVGTVSVEAPLMEKLMILKQKSGSELTTIFLAAWAIVVSRLSAQDAVIIGIVRKKNKGLTVHAPPMHVELAGVSSTLKLIDRVSRTLFSDFSPSGMVDGESAPKERSLPPQAAFYLHNDDLAFPTADNVSVRSDLELHLLQDKKSLVLVIRRTSDLDNEGAIERYAGYLKTVLMHMTANSSQPIDSFDILSPEEKHLFETWNQTDAEYPDRCIQHFFEEQVERSPEAVAVVHNEQEFTYAELNLLATRFASQLLKAGVRRGDSVAMLLERSVELVATQLAVLKAGASYVPIDPRATLEQQAFILKDSGAVLLVTHTNTEIHSTLEVPLYRLDISVLQATDTIELEACESGSSSDTAYVMYTSGSTGVPKAIVVPHRAIACRVFTKGFADIGSSDREAFATIPSHSPSTFDIWATFLQGARIVIIDNDIVLDPHRLAAAHVYHQVTNLYITNPLLSTIYQKPTLPDLAEVLSDGIVQEDMSRFTISRANREGPLELSFAQQRLWFLAQMDGVSEIYHVPTALRLHGTLEKDALQKALNGLFERHESLRTVFVSTNGQPKVQLLPAKSGWTLEYHDLRAEKDKEAVLEHLKAQEVSMTFDLEKGPLVRVLLIQIADKEQVVLFTMHHIIVDGWSMGVLFRDLSDLYGAYCSGMSESLAPLSIQYPDYAAWQRQWLTEDRLEDQAVYWRKTLAGAPVILALPTDRPRPRQQSFAGGFVPIQLDAELTSALHTLCHKHGITMFMAILAAWSAVLSRLSGQDDIVIGTPVANRNHPQVEQLIGFFVNTLALRIDLSGEPNVEQILDRVRKTTIAAQAHQDMPFEQVVEIVHPPRRTDQTPIFQVMLAWQNSDIDSLQLQGVEAVPERVQYDIAKFDQELFIGEENGAITGSLGYSTALFDCQTIERHVGYLEAILRWMTGTTQQSIGEAPILGSSERKLLLETWNDTDRPYPDSACIHHLFERQANSSPEAIAIVQDDRSMTYRELDARANWIAHQLVAAGVNAGEHVAILLERSIDLVASQIAILKVGAAYVPIDTKAPVDRKAYMVADSGARLLVTDEATLVPDQIEAAVLRLGTNMAKDVQAYVMYTSGSTGLPKGVMVSHRGIARLTINNGWFDVGPGDRVAFGSNTTFDLSTLDVWTPLLNGGCIVVFDQDTVLNAHQLEVALERHQVNALQLPTALFHQHAYIIGSALSRLKYLLFMGEQGLIEACTEVLRHGGPVRLFNEYGPTEATVNASMYEVTSAVKQLRRLPIGRPVGNTRLYVLDKHLAPLPIGVAGELHIGGPGVANGYLNRPELTAERFVPDPFSNVPGARMYRTGDLVRYLPDGDLVFLSRSDNQIKIRGYRVELGEIEVRLVEHSAVREAVVVATGEGSDKRLVAYIVSAPQDSLARSLREYLSTTLPEYMVPTAFVQLDAMPLNNNGKVDRRALPEPESAFFVTEDYVAPLGDIEVALASVWCQLLKIERVARDDNFFMLGGHSLLAVRLLNRVSTTLGVQLPMSMLFQTPTLSALAEVVQKSIAHGDLIYSNILPTARDGLSGLSFAQQRLWFLAQMEGMSEIYHVPMALHLHGTLDKFILSKALDTLYARHDSLRSTFVAVNGQPQVHVLPPDTGLLLVISDLRQDQDRETTAKEMAAQEAIASFDLEKGPLVRAQLIQIGGEEHIFLLTMHHIIVDGWSMDVLFRDLSDLYGTYCSGMPESLAPLSIQYPDYAAWQRQWLTEDRLEDQAVYWRKTLAGAPVTLALPTDRPRPRQQSFAGGFVPIQLDAELTSALHTLCHKHGIT